MADRVEPTGGAPDPNRGSKDDPRFQRLAEALRENLRKRKRQKREREERAAEAPGGDDPSLVPRKDHLTDFEA
jgi:hypothetical protein